MIMKRYIGTKIIYAEIIHAEIAASPKDGIEGYKVVYADGYMSWSPRAAAFPLVHNSAKQIRFVCLKQGA